jgi:hypothetical protein
MRRGQQGKPQWLLIKHRDEHAVPDSDVVADYQTSVATERTMDEIAEGKSRVWRSNRQEQPAASSQRRPGTGAKAGAAKKQEDSAYGRLMARRSR